MGVDTVLREIGEAYGLESLRYLQARYRADHPFAQVGWGPVTALPWPEVSPGITQVVDVQQRTAQPFERSQLVAVDILFVERAGHWRKPYNKASKRGEDPIWTGEGPWPCPEGYVWQVTKAFDYWQAEGGWDHAVVDRVWSGSPDRPVKFYTRREARAVWVRLVDHAEAMDLVALGQVTSISRSTLGAPTLLYCVNRGEVRS